jgi:hypothetical protein
LEGVTVKFKLDSKKIPNGTILVLGVTYSNPPTDPDATRGLTPPKVFTYVALKAGGLWYFSRSGRVPQAAGWGAVERWLDKDNRTVEWVDAVTSRTRVWPPESAPTSPEEPSYYDLPHR